MSATSDTSPTSTRFDFESLADPAIDLAGDLLRDSRQRSTAEDRQIAQRVIALTEDPSAKAFTLALVDQVLRIKNPARAARCLGQVLAKHGAPRSFSAVDRALLRGGAWAARGAPGTVMPLIRRRIRRDSSHVILAAERERFQRYLRQRHEDQWRVNLNLLGEAVLGQEEAARRLQGYLDYLRDPEIDYVSVKFSAIFSHISLTGYDATLETLKEKLRTLYRAALAHPSASAAGGESGRRAKFVNLDMEEYRDLHLTVEVFRSVLDEAEFDNLSAGIVLQAYLPDSFAVQRELTEWALARRGRGGAPIKIRLVKGANLAMEQVEASLHGWHLATYGEKTYSDANFKRMLEYGLRPGHSDAVRIGVASHNLFDVAWAWLLARQRGVTANVDFEMLEGMANAQARQVRQRTGDLLVYAPICAESDFDSAVAYLVRRFDENTQPGSFLRSLFGMAVGDDAWRDQAERFRQACRFAADPELPDQPRRTQDRGGEQPHATSSTTGFANTPDTDFSLPANRRWLRGVVDRWRGRTLGQIPIQVAGRETVTERLTPGHDPSVPGRVLYQSSLGSREDVELAIASARAAQPAWEERGLAGRAAILREFAAIAARQRGDSIGVMMADGGKAVLQADAEVSEAVDFAEYYARSLDQPGWWDGSESRPLGVVVVTPPWNFPYAIPAGGCAAALMAGNCVILKPAPETVGIAWHLAQQFWQAGVPRDALQFLPLADDETGQALVSDRRLGGVILTGAYATAGRFLSWRPEMRLSAETSGKNSLIISSAADLDLAVKDLVYSAFGHSGQKCSAASLALVQRDVYESASFRNQLRDAAASLCVAPAWNLSADVTPLIRPPHAELQRGLTRLDPGESWLLEPQRDGENECLWRPGIRLGVRAGSWFHRTECFGPVLGLIPVDSFDEAVRIQNASEFGLTGGLHSLDEREIERWKDSVEVGNAYVNRSITGAIVRRQPFGGWKHSAIGVGIKAGGPNYVASFRHWSTAGQPLITAPPEPPLQHLLQQLEDGLQSPAEVAELRAIAGSYQFWWSRYFRVPHDPSQLHGETNALRYRPLAFHSLRFEAAPPPAAEVLPCVIASHLTGVPLEFSGPKLPEAFERWQAVTAATFHCESMTQWQQRLNPRPTGSVRVFGEDTAEQWPSLQMAGHRVVRGGPIANGRLELLTYLREQSVTETVHRHGNVAARMGDQGSAGTAD